MHLYCNNEADVKAEFCHSERWYSRISYLCLPCKKPAKLTLKINLLSLEIPSETSRDRRVLPEVVSCSLSFSSSSCPPSVYNPYHGYTCNYAADRDYITLSVCRIPQVPFQQVYPALRRRRKVTFSWFFVVGLLILGPRSWQWGWRSDALPDNQLKYHCGALHFLQFNRGRPLFSPPTLRSIPGFLSHFWFAIGWDCPARRFACSILGGCMLLAVSSCCVCFTHSVLFVLLSCLLPLAWSQVKFTSTKFAGQPASSAVMVFPIFNLTPCFYPILTRSSASIDRC